MPRFSLALVFGIGCASLAPSWAQAADVSTIGCVDTGLTPAVRARLIADVEINMRNAEGAQKYSPESVDGMTAAANSCAAKYGWSEAAKNDAILYTLPIATWAAATRLLATVGVDAWRLEGRFMALPPAERIDGLSENVLGKVAGAAVDAGEIKESNAVMAGALLGLLAVREKAIDDFKKH